jgi:hypothetical protein
LEEVVRTDLTVFGVITFDWAMLKFLENGWLVEEGLITLLGPFEPTR